MSGQRCFLDWVPGMSSERGNACLLCCRRSQERRPLVLPSALAMWLRSQVKVPDLVSRVLLALRQRATK